MYAVWQEKKSMVQNRPLYTDSVCYLDHGLKTTITICRPYTENMGIKVYSAYNSCLPVLVFLLLPIGDKKMKQKDNNKSMTQLSDMQTPS